MNYEVQEKTKAFWLSSFILPHSAGTSYDSTFFSNYANIYSNTLVPQSKELGRGPSEIVSTF
jgi:hypothetical protein